MQADSIAQSVLDHWYLFVAGWYVWRWLEGEKRARAEAERLRREDERLSREEHREATREVVREELAAHVKEESAQFGLFRDDVRRELSGMAELVRQHDQRIRDLESSR